MLASRANRHATLLAAVSGLLLAGCATTVPRAESARHIVPGFRITDRDLVSVNVSAAHSVKILPYEESRLVQEISRDIQDMQKNNRAAGGLQSYEVDVHLTRYDKGNKFARFMLAGLGQMHIDGNIDVYSLPQHKLQETFTLKKTFAWGGIYGASTSIRDIETTFAKGVAQTVTGQGRAVSKASKT